METKHTKGKWISDGIHIFSDEKRGLIGQSFVVKRFNSTTKEFYVGNYPTIKTGGATGEEVNYGYLTIGEVDDIEADANAKLMAAAPELLSACQWAVDQLKRLADEGKYPEFMLSENGGQGMMPLILAIKNATEL